MDEPKRILSDQEKEMLLYQSRKATSPLQLKEIARSGGIELSDEMADKAYAYIQKGHKLNLQDLDKVSAGKFFGDYYPDEREPNDTQPSETAVCQH